MPKMIDLTGQRFGRLTAISLCCRLKDRDITQRRVYWACSCDCGDSLIVSSNHLRTGHTTSCGCSRMLDIRGQRYGRLIAVAPCCAIKSRRLYWACSCDCGNTVISPLDSIRRGDTSSCGCYNRELRSSHNMTGTPTYAAWNGITARCYNQKDRNYSNYGGRGIKVCDRWRESFKAFLEDMGERPDARYSLGRAEYSLDRIDVNGDYEPGNCRWATYLQQQRNKRCGLFLTYKQETLCVAEWGERLKISRNVLYFRLKSGWSVEQALETPVKHISRRGLRSRNSELLPIRRREGKI